MQENVKPAPVSANQAPGQPETISLRLQVSKQLYLAIHAKAKQAGLKENDLVRFYLSERLLQK